MERDIKVVHAELIATFSLMSRLVDEIEAHSEMTASEVSGCVDEIATILDSIYDVPESDDDDIMTAQSIEEYNDAQYNKIQSALKYHFNK